MSFIAQAMRKTMSETLSSMLPNRVQALNLRAKCPSSISLMPQMAYSTKNAAQGAGRNSIATEHTMRRKLRAFASCFFNFYFFE